MVRLLPSNCMVAIELNCPKSRLAPLILTIVATETGSFRSGFSTLVAFFYSGMLVFCFYSAAGADKERHEFEQSEIERGSFLQADEEKL